MCRRRGRRDRRRRTRLHRRHRRLLCRRRRRQCLQQRRHRRRFRRRRVWQRRGRRRLHLQSGAAQTTWLARRGCPTTPTPPTPRRMRKRRPGRGISPRARPRGSPHRRALRPLPTKRRLRSLWGYPPSPLYCCSGACTGIAVSAAGAKPSRPQAAACGGPRIAGGAERREGAANKLAPQTIVGTRTSEKGSGWAAA